MKSKLRTVLLLFFITTCHTLYGQMEVEPNDVFSEATPVTMLANFSGSTDSSWQGDMWRLNLTPGSYTIDWAGDACTRIRVVEYAQDPELTTPSGTPGASSTCPPMGTFECHLMDNLPGLGSLTQSFTVVAGRFYFLFINPHNCTNMTYNTLVSVEKEVLVNAVPFKLVSDKGEGQFSVIGYEVNRYGAANMEIFDASGRKVFHSLLNQSAQDWDLSNLNNGLYIVRMTTGLNQWDLKWLRMGNR